MSRHSENKQRQDNGPHLIVVKPLSLSLSRDTSKQVSLLSDT